MTPVTEIEQVVEFVERIKRQALRYTSNLYLDIPKLEIWIKHRLLRFIEIGKTIFILRKNSDFSHLYFITSSIKSLEEDLEKLIIAGDNETLILDLIGTEEGLSELADLFKRHRFSLYTTLIRMSKTNSDLISASSRSIDIQNANKHHLATISAYFNRYFDPFCEQVPLSEELDKWIDRGEVIIYKREKEAIGGFLISEKIGLTAYLRYWFVHPEFRDKKIGSMLIHEFFKNSESSKRKIFWVIKSNSNAIKRYEHYGFRPELLNDQVFINRQLQYEKKDY
jgi:ribosomal protein S18 acetylase RimI-like enzyme